MADFEYPQELRYTSEHEWVRVLGDDRVQVGITAYAQDALGDVVFVTAPDDGTAVTVGQACGEVESTKSVSDIYAPVAGTVAARNEALVDQPELVNTDPYGQGWMFELTVSGPEALTGLLTAQEYREHLS